VQHVTRKLSTPDGYSLYVEEWIPEPPVRFLVAILHGNAEHAGRYERLAGVWGQMGGRSVVFDQRGQGWSSGTKGHVEGFEQYSGDLRHVLSDMASRLPADQQPNALPWFVFGHSAGALTTLLYLIDHTNEVELHGALLSVPLLGLAMKVPPIKLILGKLAAYAMPKLALPSNIPASAVSRDPDEVARYVEDARSVRVVTAAWFASMNRAIARVEGEIHRIESPLLWYAGTNDQVADPTRHRPVFDKLRDPERNDQVLRILDGYYHEPHNEPENERQKIHDMLCEWIETHLPKVTSARSV